MKSKFNKIVGTKKSAKPALFSAYSVMEATLIKDAKVMGFSNKQIATLVNKKIHHDGLVRTSNGVAKVNLRKLKF
jgi:hypothetical protein